jgi:hypothetical protein
MVQNPLIASRRRTPVPQECPVDYISSPLWLRQTDRQTETETERIEWRPLGDGCKVWRYQAPQEHTKTRDSIADTMHPDSKTWSWQGSCMRHPDRQTEEFTKFGDGLNLLLLWLLLLKKWRRIGWSSSRHDTSIGGKLLTGGLFLPWPTTTWALFLLLLLHGNKTTSLQFAAAADDDASSLDQQDFLSVSWAGSP